MSDVTSSAWAGGGRSAAGGGPAGGARIAVVGGGIAGLAAALRLRDRVPAGTVITMYEQADTLGGKLLTGDVAGRTVEFGAEAFLARDPAGGESAAIILARRLGLADALVHPAVGQAAIVVDGELRPVPGGTLVGVPGDLAKVATVARPDAELDHDNGRPLLGPDEDVAVGELVRRRLGDEVVDRLVDPMLGGVYAGRADRLSLAATMPALARAARTESTLTGAVRAAQAGFRRPPGAPIFATVAGGMSQLIAAAAAALTVADGCRTEIRLGAAVRELTPTPTGWRLVIGPAREPELVEVDAVVLALPARPAARLLSGVDIAVAALIGRLDYASMALVTLVCPEPAGRVLPALSGFLVPALEGTLIKAATFFSTKWAHLRQPDGTALIRASIGRCGEEHLLQRADDELTAIVQGELSQLLGVALPAPSATHVQRWGGALPQYTPGHLDRLAAARATLRSAHPTLALAGAGYDGVGIPICVRSGETAADEIINALEGRTP